MMELLKNLCDLPGIPGREERVRTFIEKELEGSVDELRTDALGNLIALKKTNRPDAKRVMVVAHMDEIGFYVKHIDEQGFLRVFNVGYFDTRQILAKQVLVSGRDADFVGVMNASIKPPHGTSEAERNHTPAIAELFIDLGLSAEEVKKHIRPGDMVTLKDNFVDLGQRVSSKALDDRVGCWVLMKTLQELESPSYDVYGVFSVQEEVGLRGAATSAYGLEPDLGIALDVTMALDIPGAKTEDQVSQLGNGVAIKVLDNRSISTRWLVDEFIDLAEAKGTPYQLEVLTAGGTDAAPVQLSRAGVPSITLSIPCRYVHTVTEMVDKADLHATVELLKNYLGSK
ncbi:MAG: M42 family metallopeptidase [Trueperaceae bacterium]|nr:M42 family metallopeptidase [Trueperaceae bacterium]